MTRRTDSESLAQEFAQWASTLDPSVVATEVGDTISLSLLDYAGLCIAARRSDYVTAARAAWDSTGDSTVLGHQGALDMAGAAFVNGTAAHGEDYDDTFEGTPVHTSAVVVPAVLCACEGHGRSGRQALLGIAVGAELMCRLALVAPTAIHRAGFHPTAVIGALGAAAGVGAAMGLSAVQLCNALGIAGSLASGIIEYLAEGTWTKRLHAGWAAQSGLRAAMLARQGFSGPRTVLEGQHGFFHAFADHSIAPDFAVLRQRLGTRWHMRNIAFKSYACGTMAQPFIDCAIRLRERGVVVEEIESIHCRVGEATVHRLWEPLAEKRNPSTPYSAKFSVPYCIAVALQDRAAGLEQFTPARLAVGDVQSLSARIDYEVDPANEYPRNYTGHLAVRCSDGSVQEVEQPHLRGGAREPLTREEILAKFHANCRFGGWPRARAEQLARYCADLIDAPNFDGLTGFRQ